MTLQTLPSALTWPGQIKGPATTSWSVSALQTLNAANYYDCMVACAKESVSIQYIGANIGSPTGSPTADFRIETVDTSTGYPSGNLWNYLGANNTNSGAISLGASGGWKDATLTGAASISAGQFFAVKILYQSGTSFQTRVLSNLYLTAACPYEVFYTGSTTKQRYQSIPLLAVGSSSSSLYQVTGPLPAVSITLTTFNNTSSAKRGARFQVPFKCRAVGLRIYNSTATGNFQIAILTDAGSDVGSTTTTITQTTLNNAASYMADTYFGTPAVLSPATWYRAVIIPTSATNVDFAYYTINTNNFLAACPGGANFYRTEYSGSSWANTDTTVPFIDLLLDQLDDGAGGAGGLLINPGMSGGLV